MGRGVGRIPADPPEVQHYKVIDAALGVIERGYWNVADAVREQPWLPNGPIPLTVTWTRAQQEPGGPAEPRPLGDAAARIPA